MPEVPQEAIQRCCPPCQPRVVTQGCQRIGCQRRSSILGQRRRLLGQPVERWRRVPGDPIGALPGRVDGGRVQAGLPDGGLEGLVVEEHLQGHDDVGVGGAASDGCQRVDAVEQGSVREAFDRLSGDPVVRYP